MQVKKNNVLASKVSVKQKLDSSEGSILTALWRSFLHETKLSKDLLRYVNAYDTETTRLKDGKHLPGDVQRMTRAAMISNITAPSMTIKTFISLMFKLVKAKRIKFTVEITLDSKPEETTTVHTVGVVNK